MFFWPPVMETLQTRTVRVTGNFVFTATVRR
jgi:hypothetical protein